MDWMEKYRHAWNGSTHWSWDAINTPDGVAGYFHMSGAPACSAWVFKVDAGRYEPCEMVASAARDTETAIYCVNRAPQGKQPSLTVEWVFPWDSVAVDGNGNYAINIAGNSVCGDSLESMLLTGKKPSKQGVLPNNFALRLVLIMVLFVVFFGLRTKIRKKTPRKGSPRQSA